MNFTQRALYHFKLGKGIDAAKDYVSGVNESLEENRYFSEE
ncbi:hypothetical protein [Metabacillus herbersteinensis]